MYDVVKAIVCVRVHLTDYFECPRGLICSHALFSLFFNEFTNEMCAEGLHGIQLGSELI